MHKSKKIIIVGKDTRFIYATETGEHLTNLTTGKQGTREQIKTALVIPLRLNAMCEANPLLIELIKKLGLCLEK